MEVVWLNKNQTIEYPRRIKLRRAINNRLVSLQTRLKTKRVYGFPRHLIVDLINVCGLKCPICPNGRCEIPRKPVQMTPGLFGKIINDLGPYLYTLTLTNWGEPLKHPNLLALLKIARRSPAYIGFSSNMQSLSDQRIDELLDSGVDEIGVSIDGATAETYSRYRVGGDFEKALTNTQRLIQARNNRGLTLPRVRWQLLLNRFTEKETDQVESLARKIGVDSLMFVPIYVDISRMFTHSPKERLDRDKDWLPENPEYNLYDMETGKLKNELNFCNKLWDSMVVHPDGAISPCCAVINPEDDFGQYPMNKHFFTLWNNTKYQDARGRISGRDRCAGQTVCENCIKHGVLIY